MTDEPNNPRQSSGENLPAHRPTENPSPSPDTKRPHFSRRFLRIFASILGACCLLLLLLIAAAIWYSTTPAFEHRVRSIVVEQLQKSTGGRVELGTFHVHLSQLGIEADNLTIHGKEAPGQIPWFHADQLVAHFKIIDLFDAKFGLSYLSLSHPTIHIIVYPDGSTNQPTPKNPTPTNITEISNQIFNLAVDQAQLRDGLFILNARKYHFNIDANNIRANVSYDRLRKHYIGSLAAHDIRLQRGTSHSINSRLYIQIYAARNQLHLDHLTFISGDSHLNLAGDLNNFAHPQFHIRAKGALDLRVLEPLTGITGIQKGVLQMQAQGGGTASRYAFEGTAQLHELLYQPAPKQTVALSAQSQLLLTQDEIAATGFHAQFSDGGSASGNLHILHWLRNAAATTPSPLPRHKRHWFFLHRKTAPPPAARPEPPTTGTVHLELASVPLSALLHAVAPPQYNDLGFNTAFTGNADAHWTNSLRNLSATTILKLAPGRASASGEVPVTGQLAATYSVAAGKVLLRTLQLHTPGTQAEASGSLAISPTMRGSQITASVITHNLGEFDKILAALNVQSTPQTMPVDLHGSAAFHGTITGSLDLPSVAGHLTANNLDIAVTTPATSSPSAPTAVSPAAPAATSPAIPAASSAFLSRLLPVRLSRLYASDAANSRATPPPRIPKPQTHKFHIDSAQATLDYSPQRFSLTSITLRANKAVGEAAVTLIADHIAKDRYAFNQSAALTAQATLTGATLSQLMPIVGTQLPATGTLGLQVQLTGTLGNPTGQGAATLKGGQVYGEPYTELQADLSIANHTLHATHLLYQQEGGQVSGSAQLNLNSKEFSFELVGSNFYLPRFHRLQTPKYPLGGVLDFQSEGSGTLQQPNIAANLHLTRLQFADAATGDVDATAQLQDHNLTFNLAMHLNQSLLQLQGQAQLTGNYPVKARLTATNLDLNPLTKTFHIDNIASSKPINAIATLQGPLATPQALNGDIIIKPIALSLANVPVESTSNIHAALKNGTLTLDPFHIHGNNVDIKANGSVSLFGKRHRIQWNTAGTINMKVAESFSDDITSSGVIQFNVQAGGTIHHPSLNGQATIQNVNLASDAYINGLSRMNGTLDFDEGRVDLKNVTAYSGGGPIQLTGFATYAAGLYVNINAVAKGVRVRYPAGVTSRVDSTMHLQGSSQSMRLSGNVQVKHFSVSSTLDIVSFVNSSSTITLPPNPNDIANNVQLDIHITSSPSMDFQNSFAKLAGTVNLHIRGTAAQPSVLGQITITEGQATLAGTTYQLQRGAIYFNNPIRIEPTIDIDATTHVENYDISIGLHGTPDKLQPAFRSSPPLSEQDIFSLLALGRTQEEQQIYSQEESQAGINSTANALLGSAINATVSSRLQKLFGGGSVQINPAYVTTTGNATARLTVQQQISKNLTLTYATNVNSSAQQLIQGKLNLTPNLSILAVRDETGVFSLIFTIRRRYK